MCLPHLGQPAALHLDFSSVSFVDDAAAVVMRDLLRRNVTIRGCSPLISHILKESVS
jgi:anti-anti-sigma regulatory factor